LRSLLSQVLDPVESTAAEAQHLSSSSGDADAHAVTLEDQSARVVFSTHEAAAVARRSASENGPPARQDAERTSATSPFSSHVGGRR
jgi:hypothetical protein